MSERLIARNIAVDFYPCRFIVLTNDNLLARKHYTQVWTLQHADKKNFRALYLCIRAREIHILYIMAAYNGGFLRKLETDKSVACHLGHIYLIEAVSH